VSLTPEAQTLRVLVRTVWWLRWVGAGLLMAGGLIALATSEWIGPALRIGGRQRAVLVAACSGVALLPGLAYWVLSIFLRRRQVWAVHGTELVSWFQLFFAGTMLLLSLFAPDKAWPITLFALVWGVALLILVRKLRGCLAAMHLLDKHAARGFEPVALATPRLVQAIYPIDSDRAK
jgi:hypothetical protein